MRCFLLVSCLAAVSLAAQDAPVIKSIARQVQVSVVVHDKKGQPVADLTKDDFVVYDKGQEQKISYFALETAHAQAVTGGLAPGVVSNRLTAGGTSQASAMTVILIDGLNTNFADRESSERALLEFLGKLPPREPVVVYALTDTLRLMRTGNVAAMTDFLNRFLTQATNNTAVYDRRMRVVSTLEALRRIASNLAGVPGRKNLVWLTDGFPELSGLTPSGRMGRNFESFADDVKKTVETLDTVGVAIYPIDARGMIGMFDWTPSTAPSNNARPRGRRAAAALDRGAQQDIVQSESTMNDVAERSGGRAFMGSNDLTSFIRDAVSDTRVSYVIAYTPSHDEWNGHFREIKVKVKRGGVEARYRKGYFAFPQQSDAASKAAVMASAVDSPLDSTGIGLMAKVTTPPTKDNPTAQVLLAADTKDLSFHRDEQGMWLVDLETTFVIRDAEGAELKRQTQTAHAAMKQEEYDKAEKNGTLSLGLGFPVPPNSTRVRVVVRDPATGMIGSLDLPITTPIPSASPNRR